MAGPRIRPLRADSEAELNTITSFTMLTIWETLPEARVDPSLVPNFAFESMRDDFRGALANPGYRFLVAEADGALCGHAIFKTLDDEAGVLHGYCHTRYVLPRFRRQGLGSQLLVQALEWFSARGAVYALAHTHPTNAPLLGLFEAHGFEVVGRQETRFPMLVLRRELQGTKGPIPRESLRNHVS